MGSHDKQIVVAEWNWFPCGVPLSWLNCENLSDSEHDEKRRRYDEAPIPEFDGSKYRNCGLNIWLCRSLNFLAKPPMAFISEELNVMIFNNKQRNIVGYARLRVLLVGRKLPVAQPWA